MKALVILIYILLIVSVIVFVFGGGLFIMDFIGFILDDLTGSNTYFRWSFS